MSAPDLSAQDVRRRLRRRADELGLDFQQAIQYYAIERFLYRLSQSEYASKLVVKGATMLRVWHASISRPTRDIDFLGLLDNSPESITQVIEACVRMDLPSDGLAFEQSVTVQRITLESKYPGIRAKLRGTLSGARFALQLDIGIHDAAVPTPGWVDFPTLLGDPAPRIRAYHPSTAIAEKLHAIVNLGTANSRMKDFFDMWMLATTQTFAGRDLRDAITATFARRETPLPNETPVGLSDAFVDQEHTYRMWATFVSRMTA